MTHIEYFWMWAIRHLLREDDPFLHVIIDQLQTAYGNKVIPDDATDQLLNQQLHAPQRLPNFVTRRNWTDVWIPDPIEGAQVQFTFNDVPIEHVVVNEPLHQQAEPIDVNLIAEQVSANIREALQEQQQQQQPVPVDANAIAQQVAATLQQQQPINHDQQQQGGEPADADAIADHVALRLQGPLLEILQRTSMNHENTQAANSNLNANLLAILYANQTHKNTQRPQKRRITHDETSSEEEEDD